MVRSLMAVAALISACSSALPSSAAAPARHSCTSDDVRQLVDTFVQAANMGNGAALTASLASGVQFLDDRSFVGGGADRSSQREAIVSHFLDRYSRGDRYTLASARGNSTRDFEFQIRAASRDLGEYTLLGKGQTNDPFDCADQRIAIWGMSAQPRSSGGGPLVIEASADTTLPPAYQAAGGWSRLPATISVPTDTGLCGQAPGLKVASRIDPPTQTAPGQWRVDGCLASPGNAFTNVYLELRFADGTRLAARIAELTDPVGETHYSVIVARDRVSDATAAIFVVVP